MRGVVSLAAALRELIQLRVEKELLHRLKREMDLDEAQPRRGKSCAAKSCLPREARSATTRPLKLMKSLRVAALVLSAAVVSLHAA